MSISSVAIKRPVFTVMVMFALVVLGIAGLSRIGTDLFPDVSFPVVVVNIPYPGASPTEVEQLVTRPIEDQVVSLNGIDRLRSNSREGLSTTILIFKLGVDVQQAATEVRERVSQTRAKLPQEVKEPSITRVDVSSAPIITYALGGAGRSLAEIQKFAKDEIKPALEQVDGVASVEVKGGPEREVQIDLDMARIDALKISPLAVLEQLKAQNLNVPAGHFDQGVREITVRTVGELNRVEDLRSLIVATAGDGSSVRLSDVADVTDGFEELRTRIRVNGTPAVTFDVLKQSGANTVSVNDQVQAKLAKIQKNFPPGYEPQIIVEQARFIKENTHEVEISIVFGGAMAILVILLFMLDIRSTIISAFALPVSVITTFFIMYLFNFTLNMMTLLGLSLAIGLLIDDAVVVRENITKHLERGEPPMDAALHGTQEITLSVFATTMSIVAVFVPVAFMSGIIGQFFRQFGITISAAVIVSLFVAFTLDPMLSSRFSKAHVPGAPESFARLKAPFRFVLDGIDHLYRVILRWAVHHKFLVFLFAVLAFVGSCGGLAPLLGFDFVNKEDRGQFVLDVEMPAGTKLGETADRLAPAEAELLADKRFVTILDRVGPEGDVNKAKWRILTLSKDKRKESLEELQAVTRNAVKKVVPDAKISVTPVPFVEGAATEAEIMVQVRGREYAELVPLAHKFEDAMKAIPGILDVNMKYTPGQPEARVSIDRDKAARAGVPVSTVALALRAALEGNEAGKMRQGKDEIPIRVRLRKGDRETIDDLLRITIWTPKGPVSLSDLAIVERGEGPSMIEREDRERQIVIWATNGRSLGELAPEMIKAFDKIKMPPGASYHFDGQIRQMNESNSAMGGAFLLAIVFIYLILASQFESFIHPLTIMLTLPLAVVGGVIALFIAQTSIAMGSMIGFILLMGLSFDGRVGSMTQRRCSRIDVSANMNARR